MAIAEEQYLPWPLNWRLLLQPVGKRLSLASRIGTTAQHLKGAASSQTLTRAGLASGWESHQENRLSAAGLPIEGCIQSVIAIQHHQPGSTGRRPEPGT